MKKALLISFTLATISATITLSAFGKAPSNPGPDGDSGPIYFAHVFGSTVAVSLRPSTPRIHYSPLFRKAPYGKYAEFPWNSTDWPSGVSDFDIYDANGHLGRFTAARDRIGIFSEEGSRLPLLPLEPATAKRAPGYWDPVAAVPRNGGLSCKHFKLRRETTIPTNIVTAVVAQAKSVEPTQPLSAATFHILSWTTAKGSRIVAAKWDWHNEGTRLVMTALFDNHNRFRDLYPFKKYGGDALEDRHPFFGLSCQRTSGETTELLIFAKRLYEGSVFEVIELGMDVRTFSRSSYDGL